MFGITMANAQAALPHPGLTMEGTSLAIPLKPAKAWRPRGCKRLRLQTTKAAR